MASSFLSERGGVSFVSNSHPSAGCKSLDLLLVACHLVDFVQVIRVFPSRVL